jgi:DNA-binding Lrp family transcriptional regulator
VQKRQTGIRTEEIIGGVYMEEKDKKEYEEVISSYYGDEQVAALVTFKIDTKGSDQVATKIANFDHVEDVFLVTGDTDIIAKARFPNYAALKKFIVDDVAEIDGVKETKTFMVVTTFKERGTIKKEEEDK